MPTGPPDYAWLREPEGRMGSLRLVGTAVRRGWLSPPEMWGRRAALVDALGELLRDPTATADEVLLACKIILWTQGVRR